MSPKGIRRHKPPLWDIEIYEPRIKGVHLESWSYEAKNSRQVYLRVLQNGKHLFGIRLRVRR